MIRKNVYKTGAFLLLLMTLLVVSGCGSADGTQSDEVQTQVSPDESEGLLAKVEPVDATITISESKIEPAEITIPINSAKIRIKNMEETTQRISMPFYGASIDTDIGAGEEKVVTASPTYPGRVSIELNGARLGGVTVVED